jgi:hypothetical protein
MLGRRRTARIAPMSVRASCLVALVVPLVAAGCSGAENQSQVFDAGDAARIASVRPFTPGWSTWPRAPEQPRPPGEAAAGDPILAEYRRALAGVPDGTEESTKWEDDDKLANLTVQVFDSPESARTGLEALNGFARGYAEEYGLVTDEGAVDGLGDDAWRLAASWNGPQVTYHWRRGNLVLEAHLHCLGVCPADLDAEGRAWADAIDAEARSG